MQIRRIHTSPCCHRIPAPSYVRLAQQIEFVSIYSARGRGDETRPRRRCSARCTVQIFPTRSRHLGGRISRRCVIVRERKNWREAAKRVDVLFANTFICTCIELGEHVCIRERANMFTVRRGAAGEVERISTRNIFRRRFEYPGGVDRVSVARVGAFCIPRVILNPRGKASKASRERQCAQSPGAAAARLYLRMYTPTELRVFISLVPFLSRVCLALLLSRVLSFALFRPFHFARVPVVQFYMCA